MFLIPFIVSGCLAARYLEGEDKQIRELNMMIDEIYDAGQKFIGVPYVPATTARRLSEDQARLEHMVTSLRVPYEKEELVILESEITHDLDSLHIAEKELDRRLFFRRLSVIAPAIVAATINEIYPHINVGGCLLASLCVGATLASMPVCNRLLVAVDETFQD